MLLHCYGTVFQRLFVTVFARAIGGTRQAVLKEAWSRLRGYREVGSAPSEPNELFRLVEAVEGAGYGRSADSLSLGHNGIKLITSQCDRV